MRRQGVKREKNKKINEMNKEELSLFIKSLEKDNQQNSKVYALAVKQLTML